VENRGSNREERNMTKALTPEQVASFHHNGFLFPIEGLTQTDVATRLAGLERHDQRFEPRPDKASPQHG
jgi:hypothetical protein